MTIIKSTPDLDSKTKYLLTRAKESMKVSDMAGAIVEIKDYAYFEEPRVNESTGEETTRHALTFRDQAGTVYGTNSRTFIDEFLYIVDLFGDNPRIKIIRGTARRSGREYVTCTIVDD
jgi:hypothetical protein